MAAVDPTYPLYPIACLLAAAVLLLILLTSFIRLSWNLSIAFLCFWLFVENITIGIDAILWSDNVDVKLYVYCDIVTHMQMIVFVVKPMATLIITRRLYLIASLQTVELPDRAARRRDLAIEWFLGLGIPVLVAGPLYYVVQVFRFEVYAIFGCQNTPDNSVLGILLIYSWAITPPLLSIALYYPRVIWTFYRQQRELNHFLQSNTSVSRAKYYRILVLASIDVVLTLPIGIATIVCSITGKLSRDEHVPLYTGWSLLQMGKKLAIGVSYDEVELGGRPAIAQTYFSHWSSPFLAFVIFGLFGFTKESRASYWRGICRIGGWIGWKPSGRVRSPGGMVEVGERPRASSVDLEIGSQPSFVDYGIRAQDREGEHGGEQTDHGAAGIQDIESHEATREQETASHTEILGRASLSQSVHSREFIHASKVT